VDHKTFVTIYMPVSISLFIKETDR